MKKFLVFKGGLTMKKNVLVVMLSICFIMLTVVYVLGNENSLNPTISAIDGKEDAYVGEYYTFTFENKNLTSINDCEIILHYNADVLKWEDLDEVSDGFCDYYCIADLIKEGEVSFRVYYSGDCNGKCTHESIQYYPGISFKVIDEGTTDFEIEIINDDCKDGSSIQVDISALPQRTELDDSDISVSYSEGIITISGNGRVNKYLEEYDINKTIPEDPSLIKGVVVEEGITDISVIYSFATYEYLKDIWYPDSLTHTVFPRGVVSDADITIHANGMTYVEKYASLKKRSFKLNDGFTIGDLDSNGVFDADDALRILKMAAKLDTLYRWSADVDGSETVDASDALIVLKRAAKLL